MKLTTAMMQMERAHLRSAAKVKAILKKLEDANLDYDTAVARDHLRFLKGELEWWQRMGSGVA